MPAEENVPGLPVEELSSTPAPSAPNLEGLLQTIIGQLNDLKAENQSLRSEQVKLREEIAQAAVEVGPGVHHTTDPIIQQTGGPNYARRVTLVTRPVQDNPQDYRGLVQTNDLRLPS